MALQKEAGQVMERRYYNIELVRDSDSPGEFMLKFSTVPGMSTTVGELKLGDLIDIGLAIDLTIAQVS
jgi:hypothetical protein